MRSYAADECDFLDSVEEGKRTLREGRTADHDMVAAVFEWIANPQRPA